jgi:hypothetical protein
MHVSVFRGMFFAIALAGPPAMAADVIEVPTTHSLEEALSPENAGRRILIHAGDYTASHALVVPDGAEVVGEGAMLTDSDGLPSGFAPSARTRILAGVGVQGDLLSLGDGSVIRGLAIEDLAGRTGGNVVVVTSRWPGDSISATIEDCEITNPNGPGISPDGPTGRSVLVITRNRNLAAEPPPDEDSHLTLRMTGSIIHSPAHGSGVFAMNFAARSEVRVFAARNVIGGGLDSNGGVSRPDVVYGSQTIIESRGNLYRSDAQPPLQPQFIGWLITGGSGPPFPAPVPETHDNHFRILSVDDRIEGFVIGVIARGGVRSFPAPTAGPTNRCTLDLQMVGTRIDSLHADLWVWGAEAPDDSTPTGDDNGVRALLRGVTGSNASGNFYVEDLAFTDPTPDAAKGSGTYVLFHGSPAAFDATNDDITPPPPDPLFTRLSSD